MEGAAAGLDERLPDLISIAQQRLQVLLQTLISGHTIPALPGPLRAHAQRFESLLT
jgi:hypothetical protein